MSSVCLTGTVISNKNSKTVVVLVKNTYMHPKMHKVVFSSRKYHVHDEKNRCVCGDLVQIVSCRPISKTKRWKIFSKDQNDL